VTSQKHTKFKKFPVNGEHISFGDVLARKLVGVTIPHEEVQSGAHPCGALRVLLDNNTRHLLVLGKCRDWEVPSSE
jgi:hypothetical protein